MSNYPVGSRTGETNAGVREAERRYETWLESLKDYGP